jgi:hypothetical protein
MSVQRREGTEERCISVYKSRYWLTYGTQRREIQKFGIIKGKESYNNIHDNDDDDDDFDDNDNNNSIQFLFICVLTQQPKGQLQSEHKWKKRNKHAQNTKQGYL